MIITFIAEQYNTTETEKIKINKNIVNTIEL